MNQAEALLNTLNDGDITTSGETTEGYIVVNEDRSITVPDSLRRLGVQHDHNIETVTILCPRFWDGHDMSQMTVYVNYLRPDGVKGQYPAANLKVSETTMTFDWVISNNVTYIKGTLSFLICIVKTDADGMEERHWNSELNQQCYISEGMECQEVVVIGYPDIITYLLTKMDEVEAGTVGQPGAPGKSAYEYAKEAGYSGTEEEFSAKLAADIPTAPVTSVNGMTGDVVIKADSAGVSSWNDLTDKPFYVTEVPNVISLEMPTECDEFVLDDYAYYKVSNTTPTKTELIGASITAEVDGVEMTRVISEDDLPEMTNVLLVLDRTCAIFYGGAVTNNAGVSVTPPSAGMYVSPIDSGVVLKSIAYGTKAAEKILPDRLPEGGFGWEESSMTGLYINENCVFSANGNFYMTQINVDDLDKVIVPGNEYIVRWDGQEYRTTATDYMSGDAVLLGNASIASVGDDTGEPFFMQITSYAIVIATPETMASHSVGIYGNSTTVHQIDGKFIPDRFVRQIVRLNLAHYDEDEYFYYCYSDISADVIAAWISGDYNVIARVNTPSGPVELPFVSISNGSLYNFSSVDLEYYIFRHAILDISTGEWKYMTMGIENICDFSVPVPETASVGQFIMVSAVDEYGRVIATEAVDPPTQSGNTTVAMFTSRATGTIQEG